MQKIICDVKRKKSANANSKPKTDIDKILIQDGFSQMNVRKLHPTSINNLFFPKIRSFLEVKKENIEKNDVVILPFPFYLGIDYENGLIKAIKNKGGKCIAFIHDVDTLRGNFDFFSNLSDEVRELNHYDGIISPNEKMTEKLKKMGLKKPTTNLKLFDYLSEIRQDKNSEQFKDKISFAGNLVKSTFLRSLQINAPLSLDVYGQMNQDVKLNKSLNYIGSFSQEELNQRLGEGFGLVWDGSSEKTISGSYGEYLRYNNPYKVSAYLCAGMPIIIWDKAALSDFVVSNNIGIAISSLGELDNKVKSITSTDFNKMLSNVQRMQKKITNGDFTKKAVNDILTEV